MKTVRRPRTPPRGVAIIPPIDICERDRICHAFLAMALAHELKQPLNSLNLNAELLSKRLTRIPGAAADVAPSLEAIGRVVDRVVSCLEAYCSRVQPAPVPRVCVDVVPILLAAAARVEPVARPLGIRVLTEVPAGTPKIPAHADQLGVALDALLQNALEATRRDGQIVLRAIHRDEDLLVEVQDDGQGMTPEVVRRAVEIGFSTKGQDGTGLTVAKFVAYHHAGGFHLESYPGRGTTAAMVLPVAGE